MSFSSPIYADYNGILLIFIRVTFQNLWLPVRNRSEICHFEKSAVFRTLQLLHTAPQPRSGITRDYYKKLSSKETTGFDEENQRS